MLRPLHRALGPLLIGLLPLGAVLGVEFDRDVLPLLSDRCFHCHGPDEGSREAELRLDQPLPESDEEHAIIVPGHPERSELVARVSHEDPDLRMPPVDSHVKPLTAEEIDTLRRWIASGANWTKHWAFRKPVRPTVPDTSGHPIDAFVMRRLAKRGMSLSAAAPRHTLLRRLSFDLTGLPPSDRARREFLASAHPDAAYKQAVTELLSSPHHAERMAMWWLDLARYADTDGYQGDATRTNWPWRDWVVAAFQENMPFDQFTIEQFAGDLLPQATDEQILATCFHRNHMTNGEGGRHPEESRIDYVIDRVNTTGTVWMGLTLGCAQCHAHKFDPISHDDYYRMFAFFNSVDEDGRAGSNAKPYFKYQSPHAAHVVNTMQRLVDDYAMRADMAKQQAMAEFGVWLDDQFQHTRSGFRGWRPLRPSALQTTEGTRLTSDADAIVQASGPNPRQDDYRVVARPGKLRLTGVRLEVMPHASHTDEKLSRGASGEFILTNFKVQVRRPGTSQLLDLEFDSAVADAEKNVSGRNYGKIKDTLDDDPRNGWTTAEHDPRTPHVGVYALTRPIELAANDELVVVMLHRSTRGDANIGRFRLSVTDQPGPAVRSVKPMPLEELAGTDVSLVKELPDGLRGRLADQFLFDHDAYQTANAALARARRQLEEAKRASGQLNVMVLADRSQPRDTFVLERGVWDQKGKPVRAGVPAAVLPSRAPMTSRLDLARWLISSENPLTARVVVNHLWSLLFGAGLVRTPEDFGLQGERPTHPELLDWLAVELMEHDWDLRHVIRLMVTSRTYQQSSRAAPSLRELDPDNLLWARALRYRLPSWMIRDAALRASGLLNPALGGPPLRPYQPDGVWAELFMGRFRYEPTEGVSQFRRTLYAFWRRSSAPTFLFDSAQRRVCEVRTRRTNTPLHALTLLNDRNQLVAAAALAQLALKPSRTMEERIELLYRRVLSRRPTEKEVEIVSRSWKSSLDYYQGQPDQARLLWQRPGVAETEAVDTVELAAALTVASMLLNLDEAITRE